MQTKAPLLSAENLTLGFASRTIAENISFEAHSGDFICIVGENGSGKTTLMKVMLHILEPMKGHISIGNGLKPNEIGYLPQRPEVRKDFPASVREVVLSGFQGCCGFRPFYRKEEKHIAEKNMERMGISHLSERCYSELSGGQQQRALFARALCSAKKALFLDEPASGLDPNAAADTSRLVAELNGNGIMVIMISHDIASVVRYASHILHMGSRFFFGEKGEYLKSRFGQSWLKRGGMEKKDA